uniref:ATP synthase complex subunit 8 n=1 Tax=Crioceris duodecimpunctata TaxID=184539 RepID=Q8WB18_CRIDU|nr:ATP synthase F0 subunit 8 [Crioceris duodecimpunctata]AAL67864.1 ATP synthase F0 subunit 8 [Crioceris duodecimpunctata]
MPQMAPLNWVTLLAYFIIIFFMFNILNYFIFLYSPMKPLIKVNKNKVYWKW